MNIRSALTKEELEKEEISLFSLSGEEKNAAKKELHDFFVEHGTQKEFQFFTSYFRWSVLLTWRRLSDVSRDDMVQLVVPRQIIAALALDFDVWLELVWYLNLYTLDEAEMKMVYEKMRNSFFQSPAIISIVDGKEITQAEMIREIQSLDRKKNDALLMAEFYSKYSSSIAKSIPEYDQYFPVAKEKLLRSFVDLTHFFMGVGPENIYVLVDTTLHREKYEAIAMRPKILVSRYLQSNDDVEVIPQENQEDITLSEPIQTLYKSIQQELQTKFTIGADGQFENIEGVIGYLDELATAQNDEKIRDLYVFNENTGMFEWNQQLLAGNT